MPPLTPEDVHWSAIETFDAERRILEQHEQTLRDRMLNAINWAREHGATWQQIADRAGWGSRQTAQDWYRRETERRT